LKKYAHCDISGTVEYVWKYRCK